MDNNGIDNNDDKANEVGTIELIIIIAGFINAILLPIVFTMETQHHQSAINL